MKKHILLIDDDEDELTIFMGAIRKVPDNGHEFKCSFAGSSDQAIEMLKYLVPDYIFTDFNIPKMNGIELLHFVTKQPGLQNTQLYLYSTFVNRETIELAANLGAGCVLKPTTIHELVKKLSLIFTGTSPADSSSSLS